MLSKVALAYYASAGDDEISEYLQRNSFRPNDTQCSVAKVQNGEAYQKVQFRPRILRKVAQADATTTILGKDSKIPVFISPAYVIMLTNERQKASLTLV